MTIQLTTNCYTKHTKFQRNHEIHNATYLSRKRFLKEVTECSKERNTNTLRLYGLVSSEKIHAITLLAQILYTLISTHYYDTIPVQDGPRVSSHGLKCAQVISQRARHKNLPEPPKALISVWQGTERGSSFPSPSHRLAKQAPSVEHTELCSPAFALRDRYVQKLVLSASYPVQ